MRPIPHHDRRRLRNAGATGGSSPSAAVKRVCCAIRDFYKSPPEIYKAFRFLIFIMPDDFKPFGVMNIGHMRILDKWRRCAIENPVNPKRIVTKFI
jgi:hypothetical protein